MRVDRRKATDGARWFVRDCFSCCSGVDPRGKDFFRDDTRGRLLMDGQWCTVGRQQLHRPLRPRTDSGGSNVVFPRDGFGTNPSK